MKTVHIVQPWHGVIATATKECVTVKGHHLVNILATSAVKGKHVQQVNPHKRFAVTVCVEYHCLTGCRLLS